MIKLVAEPNNPTPQSFCRCGPHDPGGSKRFTGSCAPGDARAGGVFFLSLALWLLLAPSGLAQTGESVMLAWNPSPSPEAVGYKMHRGPASGTYDYTIVAGNTTNFTMTALVPGTTYFFVNTAMDAAGNESPYSNEVSYSVPAVDPLPVIVLTSPVGGAAYFAPASVVMAADVSANGHTIVKVQFYNGAVLLNETATSPYAFTWLNVAEGSYTVTALAVYDSGQTASSGPVPVVVQAPPNTPPTISSIADQEIDQNAATTPIPFSIGDVETPASGLTVTAASSNTSLVPNANISLAGTGSDQTVTVAPAAGQVGTATITLTVSDGSLSATTAFLVTVDPLPAITLTSPTDAATYQEPANIPLAAQVTTNSHSIVKVQFYNGAALLNETATPPYAWTWTNVPAGSYSLTASAVYDAGKTVMSGAVTVTVQPAATLPLPWLTVDLGTVSIAGSASAAEGVYTVSGAGNIGGKGDNFRYVYQSLSADGEIRCRLQSVQNTGKNARIGVMIARA